MPAQSQAESMVLRAASSAEVGSADAEKAAITRDGSSPRLKRKNKGWLRRLWACTRDREVRTCLAPKRLRMPAMCHRACVQSESTSTSCHPTRPSCTCRSKLLYYTTRWRQGLSHPPALHGQASRGLLKFRQSFRSNTNYQIFPPYGKIWNT